MSACLSFLVAEVIGDDAEKLLRGVAVDGE